MVRGYAETGRLNSVHIWSGLESRLDTIDNDIRLLDARLADADLATDALVARVQRVLALGGGFAAASQQGGGGPACADAPAQGVPR